MYIKLHASRAGLYIMDTRKARSVSAAPCQDPWNRWVGGWVVGEGQPVGGIDAPPPTLALCHDDEDRFVCWKVDLGRKQSESAANSVRGR